VDNIFGIGSTELILILILATVVLGPLRMIRLARDMGKLARDLRNYYVELTGSLNEELAALAAEANPIKDVAAALEPEVAQSSSGTGEVGQAGADSTASGTAVQQEAIGVSGRETGQAAVGLMDASSHAPQA